MKSMLAFMACVVFRDSLQITIPVPIMEPVTVEKVYDDTPDWPFRDPAVAFLATIAKENGCKYAIAKCTCRKAES